MIVNDSNNFIVLFASIKKKIYKILNEKIKDYDLSITEAIYLIIISERCDGISFKELTRCAECDKGMTTRVLNSLKLKNLVSEVENSKYIVVVTARGRILSRKINLLLEEFKNQLLEKVDRRELVNFYNSLSNFNDVLEGEIKC